MKKLSDEELIKGFRNGMIICGESSEVMKQFEENSVDLIYADPPFYSDENYNQPWKEFDEHRDFLGFDDTCKHGIKGYLLTIIPVLKECYKVLKPTGSMYLHCDHHMSHYLKVEMDKIFGDGKPEKGIERFNTQITWRRCGSKGNAKMFANNSDYILFYSKKKEETKFYTHYGDYSKSTLEMQKFDDNDGRGLYSFDNVSAPGKGGYFYDLGFGEKQPPGGYRWTEKTMLEKIDENLIMIKKGKTPRQKRYLSDCKGVPFDNVWTDIENAKSPLYPTEKPPELMRRILRASSIPGDVVLDPFCGGGIFIREAQENHRTAIGIDKAVPAILLTNSRTHARDVDIHGVSKEELDEYVSEHSPYDDKVEDLKELGDYDFQAFICEKWGAKNGPKGPDKGIDGCKITSEHKIGVQVKKSEDVQSKDFRQFKTDLRDNDYDSGVMIAFSFNGGTINKQKEDIYETQDINSKNHIPIDLITVKELLEGKDSKKIEELLKKYKPKKELSKYITIKDCSYRDKSR